MAKERLVLCDTNIIIEFYKENSSVLKKLRVIGQEHIAVSIVTAGELLYGALNKKERKQIPQIMTAPFWGGISVAHGQRKALAMGQRANPNMEAP